MTFRMPNLSIHLHKFNVEKKTALFCQILDDVSGSLLKKVADMSDEERDNKMFELSELYKNWLSSDVKLPQERMDIFLV